LPTAPKGLAEIGRKSGVADFRQWHFQSCPAGCCGYSFTAARTTATIDIDTTSTIAVTQGFSGVKTDLGFPVEYWDSRFNTLAAHTGYGWVYSGKLRKQERGGRLLRTSLTVGIALLIFAAVSVAQDAASGGVVPAGIYANHEKVAAALAKGGPLIDNPNTPAAIKVSGSHRDKPGVVEVHEKETDIFYVSDGEATLIAGGTRVKAKDAAANHPYDVEGGKTFRLTKGDIMVIPAGSPHWFKEVPKSISYHVVKLTAPAGGTGTDVTYVDHDKVAAALNSKGEIFSAPKLRLSGGYRTGPDQPANYGANPEVHPAAIDIFYCIDGAATVVTGGKVVGMKESGDNRMAGAKVEQGRSDHMTKGDWLLVPSGTPHWHTEYPKPFGFYRYLLVKVQE